MKFSKVLFCAVCLGLSYTSLGLSKEVEMPDYVQLADGLASTDYCNQLIASRLEAYIIAWGFKDHDKLKPDDVEKIKKNLKCYTGERDYCLTVNSYDLSSDEQTIQITKNPRNFLRIVSSKPFNDYQMSFKLKKSDDVMKITSQLKDRNLTATVEFEFKNINGVCVPWSFKQSNGAGPIFNLKECSEKLTDECQKNPYWQFYQSQISTHAKPQEKQPKNSATR